MNKLLSFIISLVLILTTITAAAALNVDTYFENAQPNIQLDPGQNTNYYIDIIPNSWATSVDVQAKLYDQTSIFIVEKQTLFSDTHNSNNIYYSPVLQITQNDYLYSGDYFIEVKATQTNTDGTTTITTETLYFTITGERLFEIDFTFTPTNPFVGDNVAFVSQVNLEGNTVLSYQWLIDGVEVSTSEDFNNVFNAAGTYDVTLRVTDSQQRTKQVTKQVVVQQVIPPNGPTANFVFTPSNPTNQDTISFVDQSTAGDNSITQYRWRIDGQTVSTSKNFNQQLAAGSYQVELRVTDSTGLQDSITKTVTVSQYVAPTGPTADFTFTPTSPTNQDSITFTSTSSQGDNSITQYRWMIDGQVVSTSQNFNQQLAVGSHQVQLRVTDSIGLQDTITKTVVVSQYVAPTGPTANFVFTPNNPTNENTITFTSTSSQGDSPIVSYAWYIDDLLNSQTSSFTKQLAAGTYQVRLVVTDNAGLQDTITKTITVSQVTTPTPTGPTAAFTFTPTNPTSSDTISFVDQSTAGDNVITQYRWMIDGQVVSSSQNFNQQLAVGSYQVQLRVTDSIGLQDTTTRTVTVQQTPLPALLLEELGCNLNVVQGYNQYCTAFVTSQGQPVQDAQVTFILQDQTFGTCTTNDKGYCKIEPEVNLAPATYTVYAEASKPGYQPDNSRTLSTTFTVWGYRYDILDLKVFSDAFVTEADTFYRSNPMYVSFRIRDSFTGQLITDDSLVREVFLRVLNQNELHFQEHTHTSTEYRYFLPSIPISDDYLGEGKVFSFVFNFNDNTAGQDSVVVNVLNNELQLNLPSQIEISAGTTTDIDFKPFVTDVETSSADILFSFSNLAPIQVEHIGNNVFRFTAPVAEFTQVVSVTADDSDGSIVTDQTNFVVRDTLGLLGPIAILKLPGSTYVQNPVTLDGSESYPRSGQIVSYTFKITRFGEHVDTITTTEDKIAFEFDERGRHEVTLTVTDDQGRTGNVTHSIDVGRDTSGSRIVIGEYEGLHISNIVVYGVDDGILDINEPYGVYATITNNRNERIENLRIKFEIPELGFKMYGSSFNLNPGQSVQRSIVGYLPFDEMDLYQDDFIVTVGVFGSGFSRNKYVPVDVGVYTKQK